MPPILSSLVASLARPGGNLTGLSRLTAELLGKNLELMKEAAPRAIRVAVLKRVARARRRYVPRTLLQRADQVIQ